MIASPSSRPESPSVPVPSRALFVTDLDGTLLDDAGELPEAHHRALVEAGEHGVEVAVVTGRRRSTVRRARQRLAPARFRLAVSNGAVVLAEDHERPAAVWQLSWEALEEAAGHDDLAGCRLLCIGLPPVTDDPCEQGPDIHVVEGGTGRCWSAERAWDPGTWRDADLADARRHPLLHVAAWVSSRAEAEDLEGVLAAIFGEGAAVHSVGRPRSDDALTEVVPAGGKGNAVRHLQESLGLGPEATAAVGDDMNDAAMLDAVGHRFAVRGSVLARRRPDARPVGSPGRGAVAEALGAFLERLP